jgi:hypothetical protein
MTKAERLLSLFKEQCEGLAKSTDEILHIGPDTTLPGEGSFDTDRIRKELNDLAALLSLLFDEGIISPFIDAEAINQKKAELQAPML